MPCQFPIKLFDKMHQLLFSFSVILVLSFKCMITEISLFILTISMIHANKMVFLQWNPHLFPTMNHDV